MTRTFLTVAALALSCAAARAEPLLMRQNRPETVISEPSNLGKFSPLENIPDCPFYLLCGRIRKVFCSNGLGKENRMVEKIFFRPYFQNRLIWAKVLSKPFARNHLRNQEAQTTSLSPRD